MKRVGVLGGSFDPIHYGHLLLAETCREACRLDQLLFVPAAVAPHKQSGSAATDLQRIEMLQLAIGGTECFELCTAEIERGGVSYTVDTLRQLRQQYESAELFFLLGADSLVELPSWRAPREICELATLAVVARPGSPPPDFETLANVTDDRRRAYFAQFVVPMPLIDLSSTDIRTRAAEGRSIRYRLPRAVEQYVLVNGLYSAVA